MVLKKGKLSKKGALFKKGNAINGNRILSIYLYTERERER